MVNNFLINTASPEFRKMNINITYECKDGIPIMRSSVVIYLDILGYKEAIFKAHKEHNSDSLLTSLKQTYEELQGFINSDLWSVKIFTDNIIIGTPIGDNERLESVLGFVFTGLSSIQLSMCCNGFFLRGSISLGDYYMDNEICFGKALVESVELESQKSNDPRIILSPSVVTALKEHMNYYTDPNDSPQNYDILIDSDNQYFLNYLMASFDPMGYPLYDVINKHKSIIESKLKEYEDKPSIWRKYAWVLNYHNCFCDIFHLSKSYYIDNSLLAIKPFQICNKSL